MAQKLQNYQKLGELKVIGVKPQINISFCQNEHFWGNFDIPDLTFSPQICSN